MNLSQLSRASQLSRPASVASLTIVDTRWTIEGDPDAVWVWADREGPSCLWSPHSTGPAVEFRISANTVFSRAREGRPQSPAPSDRTPAVTETSPIHNSEHDPLKSEEANER